MIDRLRAFFHELVGITEESPEETRQMLIGWLISQGPIYNRARMPANLSLWIAAGRDDGTVNPKGGSAAGRRGALRRLYGCALSLAA